jgi:hypothetical protein
MASVAQGASHLFASLRLLLLMAALWLTAVGWQLWGLVGLATLPLRSKIELGATCRSRPLRRGPPYQNHGPVLAETSDGLAMDGIAELREASGGLFQLSSAPANRALALQA